MPYRRDAMLLVVVSLLAASASAQITNNARYKVVNKNSGKCVDAAASATANGTVVQQWTCNGSTAQSWQFTATDSGYYKVLTANNTSQGWDVTGGASATGDGVKLQLWTNSGATNQQWQPVSEGAGYYHMVVRNSGKCLDVSAASTADGVQLQQWACNGTTAQSFQIASTTGATPTATVGVTATATAIARATPTATASSNTNLALNQPVTASSAESATYAASSAVDGNTGTRWSSAFSDPQWIRVDLGATKTIGRVVLNWEAAFASSYQVQVSNDGATWTSIKSVTGGDGGIDDWSVSGSGRYVRMYGTARATAYGYSLWELQVYGPGSATPTPTATTRPTATPTTAAGHTMEIMTWVPSYNQSVWMAALQANTGGPYNPRNTITRLAGQMFQVQANGTIVQGVPDSDVQWVVNYSNANGIKFLVCVHDYTSNWDWATAASAFGPNQATLVNSIANMVTRWGAAGADIDFEGNLAGDPNRAEYGAFIRALGTRLHGMGKELTVDIFPYIWNQPNMNWLPDWVGSVDGVTSMGYDALYGGGTSWQAYRWQQDTVLAAGYHTYQFQMGMPAWVGDWGSGGLGTSALAHTNELSSGNYNRLPTSVGIWDAQFNGPGWLSPDVWAGLHALRTKTGN
jgi:hypothetical protein